MGEVKELRTLIEQLQNQFRISEERQRQLLQQQTAVNDESDDEDITTEITNGDHIQLESYRSIPEFSGDKGKYRSWRNQVTRRMNMIDNCKAHAKYEAALGIIRAKITGSASDVLTNNKTAYNIKAIIKRLDLSFAYQRPLYVVEAEMTSIRQLNRTLQEFYDAINQALNLVISKIVMSYKKIDEQKSLISEAQQKAIRTFVIGLKSSVMRNILYSHKPKTLAEAFTTAQTVYYDNQYLHLDQNREQPKPQQNLQRKYISDMQNRVGTGLNVKMNCNQAQQPIQQKNKPESGQQQNVFANTPQKRSYDAPRQQPNKFQKINQLQEGEPELNENFEGEICEEIPDDLISNVSHESIGSNSASTFLSA